MKVIALAILLNFLLTFSYAQQGWWTWMKGDNIYSSDGNFGTQGVADAANLPRGIYSYCGWKDLQGNFWVFGGGGSSNMYYNDLWKYDAVTNMWTWIKGTSLVNQPGVYGIIGIPSPSNTPGGRTFGSRTWVDANGDLWLIGGYGLDKNGATGFLNDVWRYNIATNEWTWMKGSKTQGTSIVYGTLQVPDPANHPNGRSEETAFWIDDSSNVWCYGGYDGSLTNSDMWKFNPSTTDWTWMSGPNTSGELPHWGTKGVADAANTPGARMVYAKWKDTSGNFWLFGGFDGGNSFYSDMWSYNPHTYQWTWMSGPEGANQTGSSGSLCESGENFYPQARFENRACWTDSSNNFWMFGGAKDLYYQVMLNDLWVYNTTQNKWAFIKGDLTTNNSAVLGIQGVPDSLNKPGACAGAVSFMDEEENLYLYGCSEVGNQPTNNLWRFHAGCDPFPILSPATAFMASDTFLCSGVCIDFIDQSANSPTSWEWHFAGAIPSSSTIQNPTNICYPNPGSFTVTLIASNNAGHDTLVLTNYITIVSNTVSIAQSNDTLYSTQESSYQWYLDSVTIPGATNNFYVPSADGLYEVFVTDSNGCQASDSITFIQLQINFSADETTICEQDCINFFDGSSNNVVTWEWQFPGGSPSTSNMQNPTGICYPNEGLYDVTLIATTANGASDTLMQTNFITVLTVPASPSITQSGDTLISLVASTYQWYLNGILIPGATDQYFVFTQSGTYTVVVTSKNSCSAQSSIDAYAVSTEDDEDDSFIFNAYPNPNDGHFIIEYHRKNNGTDSISIAIVNMLGQIIFIDHDSSNDYQKEISLTNIAQGCYFLEVRSQNVFFRKKMLVYVN